MDIGIVEYSNFDGAIDIVRMESDRLKAGVQGARHGIEALEKMKAFFVNSSDEKINEWDQAIQNLKTFLGETND